MVFTSWDTSHPCPRRYRKRGAARAADGGRAHALAVLAAPASPSSLSDDTAYVLATLAPLALECLKRTPPSARLVLAGVGRAAAASPWWARLGVDLYRDPPPRVDADELFTCHFSAPDGGEYAGAVRSALDGGDGDAPPPGGLPSSSSSSRSVVALCAGGDPCDALVRGLRAALGAAYDVSFAIDAFSEATADRLRAARAVVAFRGAPAAAAAVRCRPGALFVEVVGDGGDPAAGSLGKRLAFGLGLRYFSAAGAAAAAAVVARAAAEDAEAVLLADRDDVGAYLGALNLRGVGVEVGAAYGDFSLRILDGWRGLDRLYVVDPYADQYADREATARRVLQRHVDGGRATFLKKAARDAARDFADGSVACVPAWIPKLQPDFNVRVRKL